MSPPDDDDYTLDDYYDELRMGDAAWEDPREQT